MTPPLRPDDPPPARDAGKLGLALFLASLTMLFLAAMVAYVLVRTRSPNAPPPGSLSLPAALWASTGLMILCSLTMWRSTAAARAGCPGGLRAWLAATVLLAGAFVAVQAPALLRLLQAHQAARAGNMPVYGLVLLLVALHAAHVIGGLVSLLIIAERAIRGPCGPALQAGVRRCATYWHFLDVVWLTMFTTLQVLR